MSFPTEIARHEKRSSGAAWGGRLAAILLLVLAAELSFGQVISNDLHNVSPASTVNVIVQYKAIPNSSSERAATILGAVVKKKLGNINARVYSIRRDKLEKFIASDRNIAYVSPDRALTGSLDYAVPAVGADIARQLGYDGTNIGVALVDSGITVGNDLKTLDLKASRVVYSQSFVDGVPATTDQYEHGNHVAGIIGGNGASSSCSNCSVTFRGVAPNVNLINLKALDAAGNGTDSSVIAAIQRAIELKSTYNIRVLNLSLGRRVYESYTTDPLCKAAEAAWKAGIVVVAAAGNYGRDASMGTDGYGTITSPGNDPYVITVGAMKTMSTLTRADDLIASYSSKGPTLIDHVVKPDLVAPGNRVISLLTATSSMVTTCPENIVPLSYYKVGNNSQESSSYYRLSGTSMAAPMVSGAVALMLQKEPTLTPDQVKARLMKTAYKMFPQFSTAMDPVTGISYTSQYDIFTVGAGYLDIQAALNNSDLALVTVGAAKSPVAKYDSRTGTISLVTDSGVTWGTGITWGTGVIWGTNVLVNGSGVIWGTGVVWGTAVVWGTGTPEGTGIIWGTGVIWGTSTPTSVESMNIALKGE